MRRPARRAALSRGFRAFSPAAPLLALAALAALAAAIAPAPAVAQVSEELPPKLQERARAIYKGVMCPQCAGQTLDQSSAPIADAMRSVVRAQLLAGATDDAIIASLVESYGEGVLAAPPARGFSLLVWLVPPFALLLGGAAVALALRNMRTGGAGARPAPSGAPDSDGGLPFDLVDRELGAGAPGAPAEKDEAPWRT